MVVTDDTCAPVLQTSGGCQTGNCVLDPRETWTYTCTMPLDDDTTNEATVAADDSLGGLVDDTDTAYVEIVHPAIQVVKTASPTVILSDDTVLYTLAVTSTGDTPLGSVNVADDHCSPLSAPTGDDGVLGVLEAGETWLYTCSTSVLDDTTNVVTATGDPTDATGVPLPGLDDVSDQDEAAVDVIAPAIEIVKSVDQPIIYANGLVTYTYVVHNRGDVALSGVAPTDNTCGPLSAPSGDTSPLNGLLDVGETWTYTCAMRLGVDTTNIVNVSGQPCDGTGTAYSNVAPVTDSDDAVVNVINPSIVIVKTPSEPVINPGDTVTYTYEVTQHRRRSADRRDRG